MLSSTVLNTRHSTDVIPLHVLMLSPQCTEQPEAIPPHVLLLSLTVLKASLHSTEYPPQYWCYPPHYWCYPPTVLNNLHSTEAIPHCTKQPPQYWSYLPQYWSYPPQYWCYPPDVPNNLQCTEQSPQYWTDVMWGDLCSLIQNPFNNLASKVQNQ